MRSSPKPDDHALTAKADYFTFHLFFFFLQTGTYHLWEKVEQEDLIYFMDALVKGKPSLRPLPEDGQTDCRIQQCQLTFSYERFNSSLHHSQIANRSEKHWSYRGVGGLSVRH